MKVTRSPRCSNALNNAVTEGQPIVDTEKVKNDACQQITSAIERLSTIAASDEIARDSIANLGVVLLDLK